MIKKCKACGKTHSNKGAFCSDRCDDKWRQLNPVYLNMNIKKDDLPPSKLIIKKNKNMPKEEMFGDE
jgi:hypothetical protein